MYNRAENVKFEWTADAKIYYAHLTTPVDTTVGGTMTASASSSAETIYVEEDADPSLPDDNDNDSDPEPDPGFCFSALTTVDVKDRGITPMGDLGLRYLLYVRAPEASWTCRN